MHTALRFRPHVVRVVGVEKGAQERCHLESRVWGVVVESKPTRLFRDTFRRHLTFLLPLVIFRGILWYLILFVPAACTHG